MEGCDPASPRRLRRGRDVLTEDSAVAVDTRQVSTASDTVGVRAIHVTSECIPTVVPKLAAALGVDAPDAVASGMEAAGGSSKVSSDICVGPDVLQTAVSVTTVVSEKWMERFVLNLDVLCSDVLASGEDPAGGSSDVGSDVCVVPDPLPTAVSIRTVVAEKWMDRFVLDLLECPSASRTSAVARTFGPAVSVEYSPVVLAGGRLLCPPVVTQTRPMEGCDPASPQRLRRGRDVLTEDGAVAVDARQVSTASDTVGVRAIHVTSECIPTVVPKLAAALGVDAPDAVASGMEPAGGSSKVSSDICVGPDVLQTAVSVTTVVSEKWMERFVLNLDVLCSDVLASGEDPARGSLNVGSDVCVVPIRCRQRYLYGQ